MNAKRFEAPPWKVLVDWTEHPTVVELRLEGASPLCLAELPDRQAAMQFAMRYVVSRGYDLDYEIEDWVAILHPKPMVWEGGDTDVRTTELQDEESVAGGGEERGES